MNFSGKSLQLIRSALDLAIAELSNQIGTCLDVVTYADDIEELEAEQAQLRRLAQRIDKNLEAL